VKSFGIFCALERREALRVIAELPSQSCVLQLLRRFLEMAVKIGCNGNVGMTHQFADVGKWYARTECAASESVT
jgi:hypothetical protein